MHTTNNHNNAVVYLREQGQQTDKRRQTTLNKKGAEMSLYFVQGKRLPAYHRTHTPLWVHVCMYVCVLCRSLAHLIFVNCACIQDGSRAVGAPGMLGESWRVWRYCCDAHGLDRCGCREETDGVTTRYCAACALR